MSFSRYLPVLTLLSALVLLNSACTQSNQVTEPREFTIAMSGYMMGQVDPCKCPGNPLGGHARRATALVENTDPGKGLLIVDAGKWVSLDPEGGAELSEITAMALSELGAQAINLTMRDARLGQHKLLELQKEYNLPFLSANLVDSASHKPVFPAYTVIDVPFEDGKSMEVAVIGVCRSGSQNYMPLGTQFAFIDPDKALLEAYRKVMDKPCVIILSDADRSVAADWLGMLEEETGDRPDMILSSSVHPVRSQRVLIGQTPITTAGQQGKYLDLVQAVPMGEGKWDIRKSGIALDANIADDPEMARRIDSMTTQTITSEN